MQKLFSKLFIAGDWSVALFENGGINYISNPKNTWLADPFIFQHKDETFIFVEAFNKNKEIGQIGYLSSKSNYKELKILLSDNTHFSYPNIISFGGRIYLLPENGENGGVDLYVFDNFPDNITKKCRILNGNYVDTSLVFREKSILYLISYNADAHELVYFSFDLLAKKVRLINKTKDTNLELRPAGNAYYNNGSIFMPFQYSFNKYGEKIIVREVYATKEEFEVKSVLKTIDKNFLKEKNANRIHTINYLNMDTFVVDYMCEFFSVLKIFKMMRRKIRKRKNMKK